MPSEIYFLIVDSKPLWLRRAKPQAEAGPSLPSQGPEIDQGSHHEGSIHRERGELKYCRSKYSAAWNAAEK